MKAKEGEGKSPLPPFPFFEELSHKHLREKGGREWEGFELVCSSSVHSLSLSFLPAFTNTNLCPFGWTLDRVVLRVEEEGHRDSFRAGLYQGAGGCSVFQNQVWEYSYTHVRSRVCIFVSVSEVTNDFIIIARRRQLKTADFMRDCLTQGSS